MRRVATHWTLREMSLTDSPASGAGAAVYPPPKLFDKATVDRADDVTGKKRRKNIMRSFKLGEISAVDRPAQEGARFAIAKREEVHSVDASIDGPDGYESFEEAVQDGLLKRADGESRQAVLERVRKANPSLFDAHQGRPLTPPPSFAKSEVAKAAIKKFMDRVDDLKQAGLSRTTAMETARRMHPKLFADYQAAK